LQVFERVRNERPGSASKVVAIPGDLSAENLGISAENVALLQREVSIVFHSAATLKLEAPLKDAILQNTAGTQHLLDIAKGMKKLDVSSPFFARYFCSLRLMVWLQAFIHLSTAFCHPETLVLEETTYDPPYEPEDMIKSVRWMNDDMLNELTKKYVMFFFSFYW
jgi:alcohol-forming fatty acyl-CoA reductase